MSEHGHGPADAGGEATHGDNHIQPVVWMFIVLAIVVVCWQGYNVFSSGGDAHVWPAASAVKVDLPPQTP
jgi:hypothetical protein